MFGRVPFRCREFMGPDILNPCKKNLYLEPSLWPHDEPQPQPSPAPPKPPAPKPSPSPGPTPPTPQPPKPSPTPPTPPKPAPVVSTKPSLAPVIGGAVAGTVLSGAALAAGLSTGPSMISAGSTAAEGIEMGELGAAGEAALYGGTLATTAAESGAASALSSGLAAGSIAPLGIESGAVAAGELGAIEAGSLALAPETLGLSLLGGALVAGAMAIAGVFDKPDKPADYGLATDTAENKTFMGQPIGPRAGSAALPPSSGNLGIDLELLNSDPMNMGKPVPMPVSAPVKPAAQPVVMIDKPKTSDELKQSQAAYSYALQNNTKLIKRDATGNVLNDADILKYYLAATATAPPVVKAPVVQAPVVQALVVKAPVVQAPVVKAPVVQAPVPAVDTFKVLGNQAEWNTNGGETYREFVTRYNTIVPK